MHVLVVEDDRSIQMVLELVLTQASGCRVSLASNGMEGLSLLTLLKPDLVLLDIMMPEMDGFQVCELAKKQVETQSIPIIFLTAQPQPELVEKALKMGAAGYLLKPFDPIELLGRINEILKRIGRPQLELEIETDDPQSDRKVSR